jgi:hypothetical protein
MRFLKRGAASSGGPLFSYNIGRANRSTLEMPGVCTVSDHAHSAPAIDPKELWEQRELNQFGVDDGDASRAIGLMLTAFFFYSFVVMIGVSLFTWWAVVHHTARLAAPATAATDSAAH